MFKSFDTGRLKAVFLRMLQSGWTLLVLVGLSLMVCNIYGRQAFMIWGLSFAGVVLIGFSIFLGNLPYRLLPPDRPVNWHATVWSWVIWGTGLCCIVLSSLAAEPALLILFEPAGALPGLMFCMWVSRKELLRWIR